MTGVPDLGWHLRDEEIPVGVTMLLRGGPDSADKLRAHAARTARAYVFEGAPASGVSMFAVLDDVGPGARESILGGKLATYRFVHEVTLDAVHRLGLRVVPTFARPHVTVLLGLDRVEDLLRVLGSGVPNPHYGQVRRPGRRRPT